MSPLYLDLLDKEQLKIFEKLKYFSPQFVLAGGTAIMLQIGHRRSYDFDCFTEKTQVTNRLTKKIESFLGIPQRIEVQTSDMILLKTIEGIDVSFVSHPFKPLRNVVSTASISLFHLDDLAANKAFTIGRRGVWRDYVDLFILLTWKLYTLEKIISLAEKKFTWLFNPKLFLQQLSYFGDVDIVKIEFFKENYTPKEIKTFLTQETKKYFKSYISS